MIGIIKKGFVNRKERVHMLMSISAIVNPKCHYVVSKTREWRSEVEKICESVLEFRIPAVHVSHDAIVPIRNSPCGDERHSTLLRPNKADTE